MSSLSKLEAIFFAALENVPGQGRATFLDKECSGDADLRQRVEKMLAAQASAGSFLEAPPSAIACDPGPTTAGTAVEQPGTQIGRYKLLEQVGEGGMGVVFVAEQTEPVRRRVALKIIKPGMDTKQVIARFEAERQALAMMDHPNIAKILDAGTTGEKDEGGRMKDENRSADSSGSSFIPHPSSFPAASRPYFVMELVRGMPITEYCDKARLVPRRRLELFVDVCQAVQHAHQKGIIHRDLKPSNVMITLHDGRPVVKVIDFGVAKAVGQQLTERTIYTALTQLVGTPLYMSPEQAEMSGLDVDTRSDVYSLGVLLYELLTGQTPFDKEALSKAGLDEMRRIIREDEPETVSARNARTKTNQPGVDAGVNRRVHAARNELDWIVMKALEKDRSRRYESASALATDIQRYLSDEPVLACPPTTMYRFQKFARKHKPALATAAVIAASLILGTTVSAWQAIRATAAEGQAAANEQKAVANEQKASANAANAQLKEQEAIKQRDEVKALADKLVAKEQQLQQTLYGAHMNLAQRAWDSKNIPRVNELLEQHRPKPGETDLRAFEWHYLYKLCHPELRAFPSYYAVAYSPDGKRMAIGANSNVKVLDAQTNQELLTIKTKMRSVAFSPDSKRLATAHEGAEALVKVWDAQTGEELHAFKGHTDDAWRVTFSPDGKRLASAGYGKGLIVRDSENGREIFSIPGVHAIGGRYVAIMAFSPDGKRLVTGGGHQVTVWDAETGREVLSLKGRLLNTVAYSPDGTRLASGSDDESPQNGSLQNYRVRLWSAQSGEVLLTVKGDAGRAIKLAFSPDGKFLAGALNNRTVKVWNAQTGDELLTFIGHNNNVLNLEFGSDGKRLALAGGGGGVKVFDVFSMLQAPALSADGVRITRVALSPDGNRVASIISDQTAGEYAVKLREAKTGQEILSFKASAANRPFVVAISPDAKRLASGFGTKHETKSHYVAGEVKVWDAQTGQEIITFKGHTASVVSLAFSPDSTRLMSASGLPSVQERYPEQGPGEVKVWDVATGQETLTLRAPTRFVYSVAYSPDGKRLATLSLNTLNVWDAQSGAELHSLPAKSLTTGSVAFSPDGKRLASTNELDRFRPGQVKLFSSETGKELLTLQGHSGWVTQIAFSPDGRRLALGGAMPELKLWDTETGEELLTFDNIGDRGIFFSPDGHRLVTASGRSLKILDATPLPEKP